MAYVTAGNVLDAAYVAGLDRDCHYWWLSHDNLNYAERFQVALRDHKAFVDHLVLGRILDPQGNRGSDILLMFYGKAINPEKFREVVGSAEDEKQAIAELRKLAREERKRWQEQQGAEGNTSAVAEAEALLETKRGEPSG